MVLKRLIDETPRLGECNENGLGDKERWAHEWMECHLHHLVFPPRMGEQRRRSASRPVLRPLIERRDTRACVGSHKERTAAPPRTRYLRKNKTKQNPRVPLRAAALSTRVAPELFLKMARGLFSARPSRLARSRRE